MLSPQESSDDAEMDAFCARLELAHAAVTEKAKLLRLSKSSPGIGEVKCPSCPGTIRFRVLPGNGHKVAACSTKGCCSFRE